MQVAFRNVSNNVSYKYIVLRKGRTKKDDDVHLWERLVHGGPYKNRCLRIPKERCYVGGRMPHLQYFTMLCKCISE